MSLPYLKKIFFEPLFQLRQERKMGRVFLSFLVGSGLEQVVCTQGMYVSSQLKGGPGEQLTSACITQGQKKYRQKLKRVIVVSIKPDENTSLRNFWIQTYWISQTCSPKSCPRCKASIRLFSSRFSNKALISMYCHCCDSALIPACKLCWAGDPLW